MEHAVRSCECPDPGQLLEFDSFEKTSFVQQGLIISFDLFTHKFILNFVQLFGSLFVVIQFSDLELGILFKYCLQFCRCIHLSFRMTFKQLIDSFFIIFEHDKLDIFLIQVQVPLRQPV